MAKEDTGEDWNIEADMAQMSASEVYEMFTDTVPVEEETPSDGGEEEGIEYEEEGPWDGGCGHENHYGWTCERNYGHEGPHMLNPAGRYDAPMHSWDDSGRKHAETGLEDLLEEEVEAVEGGTPSALGKLDLGVIRDSVLTPTTNPLDVFTTTLMNSRAPWPGTNKAGHGHIASDKDFADRYDPPTGYEYTGEFRNPEDGDLFLANNGQIIFAGRGESWEKPRHILRPLPGAPVPKRGSMNARSVGEAVVVEEAPSGREPWPGSEQAADIGSGANHFALNYDPPPGYDWGQYGSVPKGQLFLSADGAITRAERGKVPRWHLLPRSGEFDVPVGEGSEFRLMIPAVEQTAEDPGTDERLPWPGSTVAYESGSDNRSFGEKYQPPTGYEYRDYARVEEGDLFLNRFGKVQIAAHSGSPRWRLYSDGGDLPVRAGQDYALPIDADDQDPDAVEFYNRKHPGSWCGHRVQTPGGRFWKCERLPGHVGPHMLQPGRWPSAEMQAWDDDGNSVESATSNYQEIGEHEQGAEEELVFVEPFCRHRAIEGWWCERTEGHTGLHMLNPVGRTFRRVWDDTGEMVDNSAAAPDPVPASELMRDEDWGPEFCLHKCEDTGQRCERKSGHTGLHMVPASKTADKTHHRAWGEDGRVIHDPRIVDLLAVAPAEDDIPQEIVARVERGAELLTKLLGHGWHNDINVNTIDETTDEKCLVAQAFGVNFPEAMIKIWGEGYDETSEIAHDFGFDDNEGRFDQLRQAWINKVTELRATEVPF